MRSLVWMTVIALSLPAAGGPAWSEESPAATADDAIIEALIKQLGADDFRSREAASEKLAKLGKTARPALEQAAKESQSPEVRWRADQLLQQLQGAGEKPLGAETPRPEDALPGAGGVPVPPNPFGNPGQDMAERVRKLFEQLQKGGAGLLPDGLLARPRLEAEGLVLEQIGAGQVQLKVKRDAETGAATVEDLYVGRSLTEILEANPELAKLPGMEDLKRQDAKRSWPGMEDFFKRGMSGGRVSPFPGGSGFTFSSSSGVSYSQDANGVTVKITEPDKEGKPVTKEYKGASIEEIKKAHPEIADKLNGMNVTMRVMPPNFFWPNRPRSSPFIGPTTPSARPRSVPRHGLFGISLEKPDDALASHLKLRPGSAAIVRSVTPGSPAHKLGLQVNDIIVEINGSPVSLDSAIATLRGIGAGAGALELEIIRAGEPRTLSR